MGVIPLESSTRGFEREPTAISALLETRGGARLIIRAHVINRIGYATSGSGMPIRLKISGRGNG